MRAEAMCVRKLPHCTQTKDLRVKTPPSPLRVYLFFMHNTKRFKVATTSGGAELRRLGWWRTKACKWSDKSVELRISCWYAKMHELSNLERCALRARYAGMDGQLGTCVRVCGCWAVSQCRWGLPIWQQHTVDSSIFIKCYVCCCSALLRYIPHIYLYILCQSAAKWDISQRYQRTIHRPSDELSGRRCVCSESVRLRVGFHLASILPSLYEDLNFSDLTEWACWCCHNAAANAARCRLATCT